MLTLVDHAVGTDPLRYGGDYLAGGSEDDLLFGQLGNDTIQGDGNIDNGAYANRGSNGLLTISVGTGTMLASDGDDYIEGGAATTSSSVTAVATTSSAAAPTCSGWARRRPPAPTSTTCSSAAPAPRPTASNQSTGHGTDSDAIVGDNGRILRLVSVGTNGASTFLGFNYDVAYTPSATVTNGDPVRRPPRRGHAARLHAGWPRPGAHAVPLINQNLAALRLDDGRRLGADEIHGEAGDDTVYAGGGNDVVYGDGGDDDDDRRLGPRLDLRRHRRRRRWANGTPDLHLAQRLRRAAERRDRLDEEAIAPGQRTRP